MAVLVDTPQTLTYSGSDEELRLRIRSWIAEHDMGPPPDRYEDRVAALTEWQAALHGAGFMGLSWPTH